MGVRLKVGPPRPPNNRHRGLEEFRLIPDPVCFLSCRGLIYSFNHSIHFLFRKFLLSPFYVPSTVLAMGDTAVNEEIGPLSHRAHSSRVNRKKTRECRTRNMLACAECYRANKERKRM